MLTAQIQPWDKIKPGAAPPAALRVRAYRRAVAAPAI